MMTTPKQQQVYLPDEVFSIVKEYAGIYDMKTTISKMDKTRVNWARIYIGASWRKHYDINGEHGGVGKTSKSSDTKKIILNYIYHRKWTYAIAKYIEKLCLPNVDKKYAVGDEITYRTLQDEADDECGIITKINDYSITFKPYQVHHLIRSYPVKQNDLNSYARRNSEIYLFNNPTLVEHSFWNVKYYDKTKFKKARNIPCGYGENKVSQIKNLMKKENKFNPLWNSELSLSEFICNKEIVFRDTAI
tara:strand:- start:68 stop:808 length:741 start_codon:yes stop_codon:yes gene_type:complete